MRAKLGESLPSIQRFDTQLEQATTSSLEALKAFSLGMEKARRGKNFEAIPFYQRAIDLDPSFALAYSGLAAQYSNTRQAEMAVEPAEKAFSLRARVTEREKFRIAFVYYLTNTRELDKAIETMELYQQTYPQDYYPRNNLSLLHYRLGQCEKAAEEARAAILLRPDAATPYTNLISVLMHLDRFDEAKAAFQQAVQQRSDGVHAHRGAYVIAFIEGDEKGLQEQLDWLEKDSSEHYACGLQAGLAAQAGRLRQARNLSRRATKLAVQKQLKDVGASFALGQALNEASCGLCRGTIREVAEALELSRAGPEQTNISGLHTAAFALALCGETGEAEKLADELAGRWPKATLSNSIYLPVIRATIELHRGNADRAERLLEATVPYDRGAAFWSNYVRGKAHLRLRQGPAATAEFQRIIAHRGWGLPHSIFYPLAHLGLARALALTGDTIKSREAYQMFFTLWKDADSDIPILVEAKKEYERLK
ncbi:MAG TPA: tetratricopeptide repeat protein [Blastocatellia bacterium]|nr:tetratricopeptide repeat protein [Blastocatellia bacterium]